MILRGTQADHSRRRGWWTRRASWIGQWPNVQVSDGMANTRASSRRGMSARFSLLAELPLDFDLPSDTPVRRSCGACQACHDRLSNPCDPGRVCARYTSLYLVPHDRASGRDSRGNCAPRWEIGFSAAMSARKSARRTAMSYRSHHPHCAHKTPMPPFLHLSLC